VNRLVGSEIAGAAGAAVGAAYMNSQRPQPLIDDVCSGRANGRADGEMRATQSSAGFMNRRETADAEA